MKIIKYPDGSAYVELEDYRSEYTFRLNSYEDLWHLNQLVDACFNKNIVPTITIPNLIDAQADRRFSDKQSSGLKLVCNFLNSMPANFRIFHPHNPEVVEALMDNVEIIDNSKFIRIVLREVNTQETPTHSTYLERLSKNLILMSSDAGGFKPLMKLCDKIGWKGETYSASKARIWGKDSGTQLIQLIDVLDFHGKDILIIDDICVYGGTFKGLSKMLRERNCGKLYLAVSHMTVQNLGNDSVTNYFDKVFTTNSKYEQYVFGTDDTGESLEYIPKNLEIIKLF